MIATDEKSVNIHADRHVTLDFTAPEILPCGETSVVVLLFPGAAASGSTDIAELGKRPSPKEMLKEAEKIWAWQRSHPKEMEGALRTLQESGPLFGGVDGVEFQRKIRDEWE